MPETFEEGFALLQLIWEQGVGKHLRSKDREALLADERQAAAYARSVALLKQQSED